MGTTNTKTKRKKTNEINSLVLVFVVDFYNLMYYSMTIPLNDKKGDITMTKKILPLNDDGKKQIISESEIEDTLVDLLLMSDFGEDLLKMISKEEENPT